MSLPVILAIVGVGGLIAWPIVAVWRAHHPDHAEPQTSYDYGTKPRTD